MTTPEPPTIVIDTREQTPLAFGPGVEVTTVRCLDCQHCQPNPHTPGAGWCGCSLGIRQSHRWPLARRICGGFQPRSNDR